MIAARGISFLASGDWKEVNISTPTVKGACYIDEQFTRAISALARSVPWLR
jgi:hypothetical protein